MWLRATRPTLSRERAIGPPTFATSILPKLGNSAGTNLDVTTGSEAARSSHAVVVLDLATPRAVQDQIAVGLATLPIEHEAIRMLAKPSEIRAIAIFKNFHLDPLVFTL